jgi:hypothetical protein
MKVYRAMPENTRYFSFMFPTWEAAVDASREVCQGEFGMPAVFRISDPEETDRGLKLYGMPSFVDVFLQKKGFRPMERCLCLGTAEGQRDFARNVQRQVRRICRDKGAISLGGYAARKWEHTRYKEPYMREDLMDYGVLIDTLETSVTWANLHRVHREVREYIKARPQTMCMTHASHFYPQGTNLYFVFLMRMDDLDEFRAFHRGIIDRICASGGSPSHHHGVGRMIGPWKEAPLGPEQIAVQRALKRHFDPNCIMNPGGRWVSTEEPGPIVMNTAACYMVAGITHGLPCRAKRRPCMKKLVIAAGIVVGIVVILAALPFVIDLNKHKGAILEGMKAVTQRQVDFEGIRLTILSGLGAEIRGLRIADDPAFSEDSFLTLKAARVKVGLMPLLRGEIVVHEVVLDEPCVNLVRDKGGKLNTSTLLLKKPEKPREKSAVELSVNRVEIQGGSVSYRDDKLKPGAAPFTVSDIDMETRGLTLSKPIPFSLAASVTGGKGRNMNITGTIGPMPEGEGFGLAPLDVHMTLDSLAMAALPVKVPVSSGSMKADITLKGTLKDRIESKVALDLAGIVPAGAKPAGKAPGISCSMKSDVVLELARERLSIQGGTFTLGRDTGTFEGTVTGLKKAPAWDITVRSDRITPAGILEQLPGLAAKIPPKLSLKGPAAFTLVTTGTKAGYDLKTRVDMRPMAVAFGTLFDKPANSPFTFTSTLKKKPEVMEIAGLGFDLGPIQAKGSGEVRKMGEPPASRCTSIPLRSPCRRPGRSSPCSGSSSPPGT